MPLSGMETKMKKAPIPSRREEMELNQRASQLTIVWLLGRGTPKLDK
jgi:hypothetical protein